MSKIAINDIQYVFEKLYTSLGNETTIIPADWTTDSNGMSRASGDIEMPTITEVGDNAFSFPTTSYSHITKYYFPNVTKIGKYAFYRKYISGAIEEVIFNFGKLKTVDDYGLYNARGYQTVEGYETKELILDSIVYMGQYAFFGNNYIVTADLSNATALGKSGLRKCLALRTVKFSTTFPAIPESFLRYCINLRTVIFPTSLQTIYEKAFMQCFKLDNIVLPTSIQYIGQGAFNRCTSLTNITLPDSIVEFEEPTFFTGSLTYDYGTFENCENLTSLRLPNKIKKVTARFADGCTNLNNITFAGEIEKIGEFAFYGCGFTNFTIPDTVTNLGNGVLGKCEKLQTVIIGAGITEIPAQMFWYCTALNNLTIKGSLSKIGNNAFQSCTALNNLTIPNTVTSIGNNSFQDCTNLTVYVPSTATIGTNAFLNCKSVIYY